MSGKDFQIPRGDRDFEDTRGEREAVRPDTSRVQQPGEGFIATLERLSKDPSIVPPEPPKERALSTRHEQGISDFYDTPGRVEFGD